MKFLLDMNLSRKWCAILASEGWQAIHWSAVGAVRAPDYEIMQWALDNEHIVLTHDLDFGAILATTRAAGPSVVQIRAHDVRPKSLATLLVPLLHRHEFELTNGALLVIDSARSRVRLLPF